MPTEYLSKKLNIWLIHNNNPHKIIDYSVDTVQSNELITSGSDLLLSSNYTLQFFVDLDEDGWYDSKSDIAYTTPIKELSRDGNVFIEVAKHMPMENIEIPGLIELNFKGFDNQDRGNLIAKVID